ncbi:MAG: small basic protein [Phycisphaerae bacterium]|nr:small basic protein [Phycisphaerae bacterium]
MSIDRSLKLKDALVRHRNVLSRAERVDVLKDEERWNEGDAVMGLPKVAHRKSVAGKKAKAEEAAEAAVVAPGAPAEAPAAPAAGAKPSAKGSAPAAGAKPSAKGFAKA